MKACLAVICRYVSRYWWENHAFTCWEVRCFLLSRSYYLRVMPKSKGGIWISWCGLHRFKVTKFTVLHMRTDTKYKNLFVFHYSPYRPSIDGSFSNTDIAFKIWIRGIFHPTWMIKLNQIRMKLITRSKTEFAHRIERLTFWETFAANIHDLIFQYIFYVDLFQWRFVASTVTEGYLLYLLFCCKLFESMYSK